MALVDLGRDRSALCVAAILIEAEMDSTVDTRIRSSACVECLMTAAGSERSAGKSFAKVMS
jgi:hypothetical protein